MLRNSLLTIVVAMCVWTAMASADERTWKSADGAFSVKAKMIKLEGESLHLRRADNGNEVVVKLSQLSVGDREFARTQAATTAAASPPLSPLDNSSTPVIPVENNNALNAKMRQLAEKHGLATMNGLPVVKLDSSKSLDLDERHRAALASFLDLVALGLDPEYFGKCGPAFVYHHFPNSVFAKYATGGEPKKGIFLGAWKGSDEFEQRAIKEEFLKAHGDELEGMAVTLPIRLAVVSQVRVSPYDFSRNGITLDASVWSGASSAGWTDSFPILPANRGLTKLNVTSPPNRVPAFWPMDPADVQKLPGDVKTTFRGQTVTQRWAYYGAEVTLRSVSAANVPRNELPLIVATVDSLAVYADESFDSHFRMVPFQQFPPSVLETSSEALLLKKGQSIPLDELAIAALIAREHPDVLGEEVWPEMWTHLSRLDESLYNLSSKDIAHEASADIALSAMGMDGYRDAHALSQVQFEERRAQAKQTLEMANLGAARAMQLQRRPFFPPHKGTSSQFGNVTSLTPDQRRTLQVWLKKRVEMTENHFTVFAMIGQRYDEDTKTQVPTLGFDRTGKRVMPTAEVRNILTERGDSPEQFTGISNVLDYSNGRLGDRRLITDLLRSPGELSTDPTLRLPVDFDSLLGMLPPPIIKEAMANDGSSPAVQIELQIDRVEFLDISRQRGRDAIVLHASPLRLKVFQGDQAVFDKAIDREQLAKLASEMSKTAEASALEPASPSQGPGELTPSSIPLLIAKYQPKFFDDHLDQFVVTRLQHEYSFRANPTQNTHGVDPTMGEVFPAITDMPDETQRRQLASSLKTWTLNNVKALGDRFTIRFNDVAFKPQNGGETPSPAFIGGTAYDTPYAKNIMHKVSSDRSSLEYELQRNQPWNSGSNHSLPERFRDKIRDLEVRLQTLNRLLSIAPPEIYISQSRDQFVIPDANGERSLARNQGAMGGNAAGSVAGIPIAKPSTEPIFPLLRVDKEIWLPENAAIRVPSQQLLLEVTMDTTEVEIVDEPPSHPWIDACNRYGLNNGVQAEVADEGQYAIIHVALRSAQLINANTGETALPLVLKNYRTVEERHPDNGDSDKSNETQPTDQTPTEEPMPSEFVRNPVDIQDMAKRSTAPINDRVTDLPPSPEPQDTPSQTKVPGTFELVMGEFAPDAKGPVNTQEKGGGFLGIVVASLGLLAVFAICSIVVMWRMKNGHSQLQASRGKDTSSD